jgi:hypothetical protein
MSIDSSAIKGRPLIRNGDGAGNPIALASRFLPRFRAEWLQRGQAHRDVSGRRTGSIEIPTGVTLAIIRPLSSWSKASEKS